MRKPVIFLFACCFVNFFWSSAKAQSPNLPLNMLANDHMQRLEIKTGVLNNNLFTDLQPYSREESADFVNWYLQQKNNYTNTEDGLQTLIGNLSPSERQSIEYLITENPHWFSDTMLTQNRNPIFNRFYKNKAQLYSVDTDQFKLAINPLINFTLGKQQDYDQTLFINTRGAEVYGSINNKVGFYTMVSENQALHPQYVREWQQRNRALPGVGFFKRYKSGHGYDYFNARGHISFRATENIGLQFGHGSHFLGNGHRSLLLSNFSDDYLYLRANTKIWRFNYQNLFTEFNDRASVPPGTGDRRYNKKYGAFHYLSLDVTNKWNVALFEGIIHYDRQRNGRGFELQYLNPVIFYRAVEHDLGSPDNAIVGLNTSVLPVKNLMLYGQVMLDEFHIGELLGRNGKGSYKNKYGVQLGLRYIDVLGIANLDYRGEMNAVRPYTYSHFDTAGNYVHHNQPLAHPLGANFREFVNIFTYRPYSSHHTLAQFMFEVKWIYAVYGRDAHDTLNWGGNIAKVYTEFEREYGNTIAQGTKTTLNLLSATATWMPYHNLFLDFNATVRDQKSELEKFSRKDVFFYVTLRLNLPQNSMDF